MWDTVSRCGARLFVAQGFGWIDPRGGAGRIKGSDERDEHGDEGDEDAVGEARREGDVVDGVDLGGEGDQVAVSGDDTAGITDDETENGSDHSDEHALEHKDAADLPGLGA